MHHARLFLFLVLACFAVAAGGCFFSQERHVEGSTSAVAVEIAGVSLADECGSVAARCGAPEPGFAGDCESGSCCDLCQQSSVTFAITADGDAPATFAVRSVGLLDSTGVPLMPLDADNARSWSEEGYQPWDQVVGSPSDMQVLYDLRNVDWSAVTDPYSRTYQVRIEVLINGVPRVLTSAETTREAPIVT
jgi:hypothetical protein